MKKIVIPFALLFTMIPTSAEAVPYSNGYANFDTIETQPILNSIYGTPVSSYTLNSDHSRVELAYNRSTGMVGTTFAVDRHTLITAAHVAQQSYNTFNYSNIEVQIDRKGRYLKKRIAVTKVIKLPNVDGVILKTKEDVTPYMTITKIASETTVNGMTKGNTLTNAGFPNMGQADYPTKYRTSGQFIKKDSTGRIMFIRMPIRRGQSGSPILKSDSAVGVAFYGWNPSGGYPNKYADEMAGAFLLNGNVRQTIINNKS